jgi:hypothetical protein
MDYVSRRLLQGRKVQGTGPLDVGGNVPEGQLSAWVALVPALVADEWRLDAFVV